MNLYHRVTIVDIHNPYSLHYIHSQKSPTTCESTVHIHVPLHMWKALQLEVGVTYCEKVLVLRVGMGLGIRKWWWLLGEPDITALFIAWVWGISLAELMSEKITQPINPLISCHENDKIKLDSDLLLTIPITFIHFLTHVNKTLTFYR